MLATICPNTFSGRRSCVARNAPTGSGRRRRHLDVLRAVVGEDDLDDHFWWEAAASFTMSSASAASVGGRACVACGSGVGARAERRLGRTAPRSSTNSGDRSCSTVDLFGRGARVECRTARQRFQGRFYATARSRIRPGQQWMRPTVAMRLDNRIRASNTLDF